MLLFIVIFFAMVIAVGAAAILGFTFYTKRRTKSFSAHQQRQFTDSPPPSLFEPDAEELRLIERENENRLLAKIAAEERQLKAEKSGKRPRAPRKMANCAERKSDRRIAARRRRRGKRGNLFRNGGNCSRKLSHESNRKFNRTGFG